MQGVARKLVIDTSTSFSGSLAVSEALHIKGVASSIKANVSLIYKGHPFNVQFDTSHALV